MVQRTMWLSCWLMAAALSLAEGARVGQEAMLALTAASSAVAAAGAFAEQMACVRANVKLSAADSIISALLVRGAPYLGGGLNLVERDAAGRPSLARYFAVEPWLEITNATCLDGLIRNNNNMLIQQEKSKVMITSSGIPITASSIYDKKRSLDDPFTTFKYLFQEATATSGYDYPGRGGSEVIKTIEAQTAPLNGGSGQFTSALSWYSFGQFQFYRLQSNGTQKGCSRLASSFLSAIQALPTNFTADVPAYTAFARRFGLQALSVAEIGQNNATYSNGRETVVLQSTGSIEYAGEACVNPPPCSLQYGSLNSMISYMSQSGFLSGENLQAGRDVRISNLGKYMRDMVRDDQMHASAAPTGHPTSPTAPTAPTSAPTPPPSASLAPTPAAPQPTAPTTKPATAPVDVFKAPSSADVLRTHTVVLTITIYLAAMVF